MNTQYKKNCRKPPRNYGLNIGVTPQEMVFYNITQCADHGIVTSLSNLRDNKWTKIQYVSLLTPLHISLLLIFHIIWFHIKDDISLSNNFSPSFPSTNESLSCLDFHFMWLIKHIKNWYEYMATLDVPDIRYTIIFLKSPEHKIAS